MKRLVALLTALCLAVTPVAVIAEENTTDVLDNSAELAEVEENGIPTEMIVNEMKTNADALYTDGKYEEAADAYYETAKVANYLANIMSRCIEPYYSARSDSKSIPEEIRDSLATLEKKSNILKNIRNTCYVYQGLCYSNSGDKELALAVLLNALSIIETSQRDIWTLAAEEVMVLINYKSYEEIKETKEKIIKRTITKQEEQIGEEENDNGLKYYEWKKYDVFVEHYGEANGSYAKGSNEIEYYYDDFTVHTYKTTGIIFKITQN